MIQTNSLNDYIRYAKQYLFLLTSNEMVEAMRLLRQFVRYNTMITNFPILTTAAPTRLWWCTSKMDKLDNVEKIALYFWLSQKRTFAALYNNGFPSEDGLYKAVFRPIENTVILLCDDCVVMKSTPNKAFMQQMGYLLPKYYPDAYIAFKDAWDT
jgi:hypothetical protein